MPTGWTLYKDFYVPTATPTGEAGGFLKDNFKVAGDKIEVLEDLHSGGLERDNLKQEDNVSYPISFSVMVDLNGEAMTNAGGAGLFRVDVANIWDDLNTNIPPTLLSESANSNTKTDTLYFESPLPVEYVDGSNIDVIVSACYTGFGTIGFHTIDIQARLDNGNRTVGPDLNTTAVQDIPLNDYADHIFSVAGADLVSGDKLIVAVMMTIQETGGVNPLVGHISSIKLSMSVKG